MVRLGKIAIPNYMLLTAMHSKYKDTNGLKLKGWKNIYHGNTNQRKDKVYFREKTSPKIKRNNIIIIKESIHQKDATVLHFSAPNNRASKCMKQN